MKKHCYILMGLLLMGGMSLHAADYYVAQNGQTPNHPFSGGWSTAASNIQDAVNAAAEGDTVWIAPGTYVASDSPTNYQDAGNVVYMDKLVSLRSSNGIPETTIINGEGAYRGIAVNRATAVATPFVLDGLTISNCVVSVPPAVSALGAGIFFNPSAWEGLVRNCIITHNRALAQDATKVARGGGVYGSTSSSGWDITISNCVIRSNAATNQPNNSSAEGGGLWISSGGEKLYTHSLIESNHCTIRGGGTYITGGSLVTKRIEACVYRGNWTDINKNAMSGGGAHFAPAVLRNCLMYENRSAGAGGGIFIDRTGPLHVYNSTIVSNWAGLGGGIRIRTRNPTDHVVMTNSIVYHNGPNHDISTGLTYTNYISYSCTFKTSDVQIAGINNITNEPMFVGLHQEDFRLTSKSPCLNAGINEDWMIGALDLDGNPRIDSGTVDIGAYERVTYGTIITVQ